MSNHIILYVRFLKENKPKYQTFLTRMILKTKNLQEIRTKFLNV